MTSKINSDEGRRALLSMLQNSSVLKAMEKTPAERERERAERELEHQRKMQRYHEQRPLKSLWCSHIVEAPTHLVVFENEYSRPERILRNVQLCTIEGVDLHVEYANFNPDAFKNMRTFYVGNLTVTQLNELVKREYPDERGSFDVGYSGNVRWNYEGWA